MSKKLPPSYTEPTEELPDYAPSMEYIGVVMVKSEMSIPYSYSSSKWEARVLELNSTQLNLYEISSPLEELFIIDYFNKLQYYKLESLLDVKGSKKMYRCPDSPTPKLSINKFRSGKNQHPVKELSEERSKELAELINSFPKFTSEDITKNQSASVKSSIAAIRGKKTNAYTLQRSQIGSASDYLDKQFVLRLRLELEQIIVQLPNFKEFLNWYWKISISAELSLPLDSRKDNMKTIPKSVVTSLFIPTPLKPDLSGFDQLEGRLLVRILSNDTLETNKHYDLVQMIYMSRCIPSLPFERKWVGKPVVIYDCLSQIDGYIYNKKTSRISQTTNKSRGKKCDDIKVKLVRNKVLANYSQHLNKGRISKNKGEEYYVSYNGLVYPC